MLLPIKVTLCSGAYLPEYKTVGSSGADVYAYLPSPKVLAPLERMLIPTGVCFEIPEGYEIQVRPRSGWALKHGITVLNTPGTIDSDYRGELAILLINLGNESVTIEPGDRIAQIVVAPVVRAAFQVQQTPLTDTARGAGGFGHTGKE